MFWARCKATPQKVARLYTDFFTVPSTTEGDGGFNSVVSGTGAGVNASVNGVVAHPGVIVFTTGSTSTGRACVTSNATSIALGGGEFYLEIDLSPATAVSDGTNRYQVVVGFGDNDAGVGQTDGLFFYYQEGGSGLAGAANSANWQCVSSNNGSRTFTTTSVPFALAWSRFGVLVNAAANSVGFYIDGTLVATHTTNIPSGTGRQVAAMAALFKSVGTSARTLVLDYINLTGLLSTAR